MEKTTSFCFRTVKTRIFITRWTTGCYAALSEPLASQYFRSGYHNMISFVVGKAPLAGIQVSLSPSPQELDD